MSCVAKERGQWDLRKMTLLWGDYVGSMALLVRTKASMLKILRDDFEELGRHKKLKLLSATSSAWTACDPMLRSRGPRLDRHG